MSSRKSAQIFAFLSVSLLLSLTTILTQAAEVQAKPSITKIANQQKHSIVHFEPPPEDPKPRRSSSGGRRGVKIINTSINK